VGGGGVPLQTTLKTFSLKTRKNKLRSLMSHANILTNLNETTTLMIKKKN
jgi:hypothetical protein